MSTLIVAVLSFLGFIVAYHTYGRWLARKVFCLSHDVEMPSQALRDDIDYVPTPKGVVFGHHFTSIAGTGPIVGPALAVFWGWLPALIWVVVGSIFIGAVHDFGSLVLSIRNRGQSLGEVAGREISARARLLFLFVLALLLTIVLAVFGLVIAVIFASYPESVLSVWIEIPLAIGVGYWVYKKKGGLLLPSLASLAVMYAAIWVGTIWPLDLGAALGLTLLSDSPINTVMLWTAILFVYCFFASVLPVQVLLQPRDYINSHELFLALGLLVLGIAVASFAGTADLMAAAPAITPAEEIPADAPPIWPFLFITIACGAVSGFHCMVGSGTSSKQLSSEPHAQAVGYGAMLLEGALAVIVILSCTAGVGMGLFDRMPAADGNSYSYVALTDAQGQAITGRQAWRTKYNPMIDGKVGGWSNHSLAKKVGAFIEGGANCLTALGIPLKIAIGILAVLVASFAATTLDTATRLQRYVIQELSATVKFKPLTNRYAATAVALLVAGAVAVFAGDAPGKGGLILWPVFGASNQLLAGLAFLVIVSYLLRHGKPVWFAIGPMIIMLVMPGWAMIEQMSGWYAGGKWWLFGFGVVVWILLVWMLLEAVLVWISLRNGKLSLPKSELAVQPADPPAESE